MTGPQGSTYPMLRSAVRTGPMERISGWSHAIPPQAREELRALLDERDTLAMVLEPGTAAATHRNGRT